jgi:hypothetical protein
MSKSGLNMSIAFWNSGCSTARNGRIDDIKNTISCSLQAAWVNTGMALSLETYPYYQFIHFVIRIIHLL